MQAKRQVGMSTLSLLIVLMVGGVFAICVVKMAPHYVDHWSLQRVLDSLTEEQDVSKESVAHIRTLLANRLTINTLRDVTAKDFVIEKTEEGVFISVDYETREALFYNIEVVMTFSAQVDLPN